jgi:hypothetical protein
MPPLHNDATMRRLELMAEALEQVVRLHREVMDEVRKGTGESDDGDERPGPAGEQRPSIT